MSPSSNARWISLSQGARVLSQLASVTVLARLLPPEAYGLLAMSLVVGNLAYLFRDMGTASALIQADKVSPGLLHTIHWTNVALGFVMGALIVAAAPFTAAAFREPELVPLLHVLAAVFPISGLAVTRQALFERESRFPVVAKIEMTATAAGLITAIVLALSGAGVYALALQLLVPAVVSTALLALASPYRPALSWQRRELMAIVRFSGNLSLFNCVNYISRNADSMVIGRLLGAAPLGIYSLAYRLMLFPVQNMTFVATRALYPVMSRSQDSPADLARLYLKSVSFIAFLSAPLMAGMFVLREPLVRILFGEKWHAVAGVLAWLAPAGFIQSIVSTTGAVFMAKGRTDLLLKLGVAGAVVQVTAFLVGARWGITGVAACYLAANVVNAGPVLYYAGKLIGVGPRALLQAVARPIALAVAMSALVAAADLLFARAHWPLLLSFSLLVLAGIGAYGLGSYLVNALQLRQLRTLIGR